MTYPNPAQNPEAFPHFRDGVNDDSIAWGPTGQAVYERTYSRTKADGTRETWPQTVERVVIGNLALVHGDNPEEWPSSALFEAEDLFGMMRDFKVLPAGRHLWASGVKGRQYLFNCHVAGWDSLIEHVEFVLMRLAEGGGVGANYSTRLLKPLGAPEKPVTVHVVCDPAHPDYDAMKAANALSTRYDANWSGAYEVEDTREGWAGAVVELIDAAYDPETKHRDRVFDVSRIRPKGARLKTMGGTASGPLPLAVALRKIGGILTGAHERVTLLRGRTHYGSTREIIREIPADAYSGSSLLPTEAMAIDHAIAEAIVAGGNRRSARMSICHWADPDIFNFIDCKRDFGDHWSTNISVEIDDDFIIALSDPGDRFHAHAIRVYRAIITGMLTNGEPGIWNSTLSNKGEPNPVIATNPCGEIALEAWENCNLGHVNMDAFVDEDGLVDMPGLEQAHRLITRFLMRATYGDVVDDKQRATLARNRRIGVGHFGIQGYAVKQGFRYSDLAHPETQAYRDLRDDYRHLSIIVDKAAVAYAHDLRIPVPVKSRTLAPTGTIAKMPGRTEGGHSVYARYFVRRVRYSNSDPDQAAQVARLKADGHHVEPDLYAANTDVVTFITKEQLVEEVEAMGLDPEIVEQADEISLSDMLGIQAFFQQYWADNAVSFTVNVPAEPIQAQALALGYSDIPEPSPERVEKVAETLFPFLSRLKGTTLMVDGSRPQAPYERITREQYEAEQAAGVKVSVDASYDEECASGACPIK